MSESIHAPHPRQAAEPDRKFPLTVVPTGLVARAEVESLARHASVELAPSGQEHGALHERTVAREAIGDKRQLCIHAEDSRLRERTVARRQIEAG